jgi:endonuclease/exonuclease/phosphatase family metal-dependent hydrolase
VRLATFNILHGRSTEDGTVELSRLRAAVREIDADVLALQEVDRDQPRSQLADLTALAADAMGALSYRFVATVFGTPGESWIAVTGDGQPGAAAYGIALLSRYPADNWQVLRLAPLPLYARDRARLVLSRDEPRAVVIAQLETPLGAVSVANTHLSIVPGWNRIQLRQVRTALAALPGPRVLLGDLNMGSNPARRHARMRTLATVPTFPATAPDRQLDHVLTDEPAFRASGFRAPYFPISDHRALLVDVAAD